MFVPKRIAIPAPLLAIPPVPARLALTIPLLSWYAAAVTGPPLTLPPESTVRIPPVEKAPFESTLSTPPEVTLVFVVTVSEAPAATATCPPLVIASAFAAWAEVTCTVTGEVIAAFTVASGYAGPPLDHGPAVQSPPNAPLQVIVAGVLVKLTGTVSVASIVPH